MKYVRTINLSFTHKLDLNLLNDPNKDKLVRLCRAAVDYGINSVVIPSRLVDTIRTRFPKLHITAVANYPNGYHSSDVVLREIEAITSLHEDMSDMSVEFVLPNDFYRFIPDFRMLNQWVKLNAILMGNELDDTDQFSRLPQNTGQALFNYVVLGNNLETYKFGLDDAYCRLGKKIQNKGYKLKINNEVANNDEADFWLNGRQVDCLGVQNIHEVLKEISDERASETQDPEIQDCGTGL